MRLSAAIVFLTGGIVIAGLASPATAAEQPLRESTTTSSDGFVVVTEPDAQPDIDADATRAHAPHAPLATQPAAEVAGLAIGAGQTQRIRVGEPNQIVWGNLTVTNPSQAGFTTVHTCSQPRPATSTSNYTAGQTVANFALAQADANGDICVYTHAATDIIWDQVSETNQPTLAAPRRVFDTRNAGNAPQGEQNQARPTAGTTLVVETGQPGATVFGNLTVVDPLQAGFTTVYPCSQPRPHASNNNFGARQTIANFVAAPADANGRICVYSLVSTHLIFDQLATSSLLPSQFPTRRLDSRNAGNAAQGSGTQPLLAGGTQVQLAAGAPGQSIMGNLTVVAGAAAGFTAVYPCAQGRPLASNSNYTSGQLISNFVTVAADQNGNICAFTSAPAHLIWDQVMQTDRIATHTPVRRVDTRDPDEHAYRFLDFGVAAGVQPGRWDSCRNPAEISVYVNLGGMSGELPGILTALARLSQATGLPFVYRGTTSILPTVANNYGFNQRSAQQDIVLALSTAAATDAITSNASLGTGGGYALAVGNGQWQRINYGFAVVNQTQLAAMTPDARIAAYLHQLGHAAGLAHVSHQRQVMNLPLSRTDGFWGNGDLIGLGLLGSRSGCLS